MSGHIRHRIPALAHAYVADNAKRLRARADYRDGPLWTVFRTTAACSLHRVVWPDLARRPKATYLEAACSEFVVPLNTCYCATVPSSSIAHTVAGVLNSVWVVPYIAVSADEARGTYRRLNARTMNRVPIPTTTARTEAVVAASDRAHQQRHADQDELDEAVAAALDLPASTRTRLRYLADTYRR